MKSRQTENEQLLRILEMLINVYPNQRFSQILYNHNFVKTDFSYIENMKPGDSRELSGNWKDEFYLESDELLKRVQENLEKLT